MKKCSLILFCILTIMCLNVFSADLNFLNIIDVRRNITMSDDDPVYKDFYINAGEGSGLKKNLVVTVKRRIFVKDSAAKPVGDFETNVGQIKIIQVDAKVSIAREYKITPRDEEPMLEQTGLMTGDRIDLTGSFIDNTKPASKKKIAVTPIETRPAREPATSPKPTAPEI